MDQLIYGILDRFGSVMRKLGTSIDIHIIHKDGRDELREGVKAGVFTGEKLPEIVISDDDCGKTFFQIYLAPKTTNGYKGRVLVGETNDDYRFGFNTFKYSVLGLLPTDVIEALSSGFFEGEIHCEGVELNASRKSFSRNDSLTGFCICIEQWFREHGLDYYEQLQDKSNERRL